MDEQGARSGVARRLLPVLGEVRETPDAATEGSEEVVRYYFLTPREVAKTLGIHVNSLKRIPPSDLPYIRMFNRGDRRYRSVDVRAYIEGRMVCG
jgi:hypothetical protein